MFSLILVLLWLKRDKYYIESFLYVKILGELSVLFNSRLLKNPNKGKTKWKSISSGFSKDGFISV